MPDDILSQFEDSAEILDIATDGEVPCEFLTGIAGSGKTFEILRCLRENPRYGLLAATTGIAAVNLNAITINSLLKYYNTDSLRERFVDGVLTSVLHKLARDGHRRL